MYMIKEMLTESLKLQIVNWSHSSGLFYLNLIQNIIHNGRW